ncbi:Pentatricopeptide repeat-containing protein, chloroplastic, partial [Cucurbita argyrosperma subsp. sororia]
MALDLSNTMRGGFLVPISFTFSSVLTACAALEDLKCGGEDVSIETALIDLYAKCGDMDEAVNTFLRMPIRNLLSWAAIISGCATCGVMAYKLALPAAVQVHPVFHVSQLQKATATNFPQYSVPPNLGLDLTVQLLPLAVLGVRHSSSNASVLEVLIHWEGQTTADATLKLSSMIEKNFLTSTVRTRWLLGAGNDRPRLQITDVYTR